ncbi:ketopantoate reductase [Natronocella acetinitrilica]|uniref:Ketopantoate reductase n=1 Tax=Natronocella acetinitrilica TaxID=414046 RepID=A0AAE3KDF1_9GAMM|nr:ketopantoate reductase [Natronocella acetinitrilica]
MAAILGEEPVLNGLCGILAWRDGPGHIRHFAIEPVVRFGERNNERTARIDDLQRAFDVCVGAVAEVPTTFELPCGTSFFSFARKAALVLSPGRL